jgi:hypothetical protein
MPDTTARSWVMNSSAEPSSATRRWMSWSTLACTVTSSAVVGSSHTRMSGSLAMAMASMTRCRWPPESWCGHDRARSSGSGSSTFRSRSTARVAASSLLPRPCNVSTSATWRPTRWSGSSAVMGSWNTIAIRLPRSRATSRSGRPSSSVPRKRTEPVADSSSGRRPSRASAVTVFPDPDSPMSPTRSPSARVRWTSTTRGVAPACTVSPVTWSTEGAPVPGAGRPPRTDPAVTDGPRAWGRGRRGGRRRAG